MQATALRPTKPAYTPILTAETDVTWTCPSERFTYVLYTLRLHDDGAITCDCMAGSWGRPCKHARALNALLTAAQPLRVDVAPAPQPRPTFRTCQKCGVTAWGVKAEGWCSCGTTPVQEPINIAERAGWSYTPAAPELMEACGW